MLQTGSDAAANPENQRWNPELVIAAGQSSDEFVLWSKPCESLECYRLERIDLTDGSSSFVNPPPLSKLPRIYMGGAEQIDFANPQDGYELLDPGYQKTPRLYATFNGGKSWHHEAFIPGETVESITSTPFRFYIIGGLKCSATNEICQRWQLSSSTVSTARWETDSRPYNFGHDSIYPAVTAHSDHVWITAQEQARPYRTFLAFSTNGGHTFRVRSVPNLPSVAGCGLTATSLTTIWAQCDDGNMAGDIEYSSDSGAKWRNLANKTLGEFFFGTFDPVTDNLAFFLNGEHSSELFELIDGARKSVDVGKPPHPQLESLDFVDQSHGLALSAPLGIVNRHVLYETDDGGVSWTRLYE
jgi:hypothetical protein